MKQMINKLKFFSKERRFLYSIIFMFVLSIFLTIVEIVGIASITTLVGLFSSAENFIFDLKFLKIIDLNFYDTLSIIFLEPIRSAAIGFSKKTWQLFSKANNEISS